MVRDYARYRGAFWRLAGGIWLVSALLCASCANEPKPVMFCGQVYQPGTTQVRCRHKYQFNIEPLVQLGSLEFVDLVGTRVKRADALGKLTSLRFLDVSRTKVDTIGKLKNLTALTHLKMNHTFIKDLRGLNQMESLEQLEIAWTRVKNLKDIATATTLKSLKLDGTPILDLEPIYKLKRLRRLSLWQTGVTRENLAALRKANPHLKVSGCDGDSEHPCR